MKGLGTSPGIGIGKIFLYKEIKFEIDKKNIDDPKSELESFHKAIDRAKDEIDNLYNKTLEEVGEKEAEIFSAHKMMLEDPEFIRGVEDKIEAKSINAPWAVQETANSFIILFENIEDEYLKARSADLKDVSKRILKVLLNKESDDILSIDEESIIVAEDLTPSDTAAMNKEMLIGMVTELGGSTSHTSIIARTLEIPAVAGVQKITEKVKHGDTIIIDGDRGEIFLNPSESQIKKYTKLLEEQRVLKESLKDMVGKETISKDAYKVELVGNIGRPADVDKLLEKDGEGVGLFRTEFLYMDSARLPTEDEQFEFYKEVAVKLGDKPLIIRTLDVGGDKEIPYLKLPKEMNPFLGYRAIRVGLDRPEILRTQLRAIYRASYYGNIKIMFPMISSIEELRCAKKIAKDVREELRSEDLAFSDKVEVGIMVEIPAVAIHAKAFAKEVDFFSIGTNDLIQYTTAVDRGNQNIAHLYNQYHPAVLRLIKMTIDGGHGEGIWVGMCGEAAGDKKLLPLLLGMGLDELSMSSGSILRARHQIRNTNRQEIIPHIQTILDLPTAVDVENYIDTNILK